MNEIIELLSAAVARENAAGAPSRMKAPSTNPCMFVVATTLDETRHALEVARPLACGCGCRLAVVVPPTDHVTVSSGRAHAYRLPADELTSDPVVTEEIVRTLTADLNPPAEVMVAPGTVEALAGVLPPGATVVIAGPLAPRRRTVRTASRSAAGESRLQCHLPAVGERPWPGAERPRRTSARLIPTSWTRAVRCRPHATSS